VTAEDVRLTVYFGDSLTTGTKLTSDALVDCFAHRGVAVSALYRGIEGYGISRRIHTARFPDISTDLPLVAVAIDTPATIRALISDVDQIVPRGLVTLERVRLVAEDDLAQVEIPSGPGRGGKLTVYCGRAERADGKSAYRSVVDLLHRQGAAAATVLLGVDGVYRGRRSRAGLLTRNAAVPLAVVGVGETEVLARVVPLLSEYLPRPLVELEGVALLKREGAPVDPLPSVRVSDEEYPAVWQAIAVYARHTAHVEGRTLHTELTRTLRHAAVAGATTIRGEWGFLGDDAPYGDRFGMASHVPTYTIFIDHPAKIAAVWPLVDELTAEHGVVTSVLVPGYRERTGETIHGRLDLAEGELVLPIEGDLGAGRAGPSIPPVDKAADAAGSSEGDWLLTVSAQATEFARARGGGEPLVRVTLEDGEEFFLASVDPRPGNGFVTLYPHPTRSTELLRGSEGELLLPRAVVVPLGAVTKIEFLTKVPRGVRSLVAFTPPERG
jgi:PII-like signaling protein